MPKKRSNGEGTLRLRADGRWESAIMDGFRMDGKPHMKYFYSKTQKEVKEKVRAWEVERASGIDIAQEYTFSQWSDIWFEGHKDNITPTTQESYKYTLRTLQSYFGRRPIYEIKPYDIEQFLKKLRREGKPDSYLASARGMLYQIFHKAEANDLVRKNPVRFADKMRSQEVLALEPRHIEPDGSEIHIRQAVNMVKGTSVIGAPKSRDSYRDIPVPPGLQYCAIKLRQTDLKYIWETGRVDQPCNPSYFRDSSRKQSPRSPVCGC